MSSGEKEIVVDIDSTDGGKEVTILLTCQDEAITPHDILEALVQVFEEECEDDEDFIQ